MLLAIALALLVLIIPSQAQTPRQGQITTNTTWTGLNWLVGDVTVMNGATLTLDNNGHNCEVIAQGYYNIKLDHGDLVTVNTSDQYKVRLAAASGVPVWGGIQVGAFNDASTHYLQYMRIENANCGITIAPQSSTVNVTISQCRFVGDSIGIICKNMNKLPGVFRVTWCTFDNSLNDAIYLFDLPLRTPNNLTHYITNCEIMNSRRCGIHMIRVPASMKIYQNYIHDNLTAGDLADNGISCYNASPVIFDNKILEPTGYALGCALSSAPDLTKQPNTWQTSSGSLAVMHFRNAGAVLQKANNNVINASTTNRKLIYDDSIPPVTRKVMGNYWGTYPPQVIYFYPMNSFIFAPYLTSQVTVPPFFYGTSSLEDSTAYDLLVEALLAESEDNYALAYSKLTELVADYLDVEDAICQALPHILSTGARIDISYESMYGYFDDLYQQAPTTLLGKTARQVRNDCLVALQTFEDAISDYSTIASAPATIVDSVFAVSDLDQISLIMEELGLPGPMSISESPKSLEDYRVHEIELMAILDVNRGDVVPSGSLLPRSCTLAQNYPNPFNPTTILSYELQAASQVKLAVYDISGRLVVTLVDGWRDAGTHSITFDAAKLASGIYVYRLTADNFSASGKMVLMK
ncbi:MAG: T9SS type A sorting domain-containing protein [bacterium]|nr:T9SS type A sorting domain-containing protein [bacterium]